MWIYVVWIKISVLQPNLNAFEVGRYSYKLFVLTFTCLSVSKTMLATLSGAIKHTKKQNQHTRKPTIFMLAEQEKKKKKNWFLHNNWVLLAWAASLTIFMVLTKI